MNWALFAYSRRGCATGRRILAALGGEAQSYAPEKFGQEDYLPLDKQKYGQLFDRMDALVFVGSCGIAVRQIAPHLKSKITDPAVLCVDELGTFVIPLLSGHIGGANALARQLAGELGATAVVTTATDINGKFSVDAWAAEQGLSIGSMQDAKAVSAAILEGDIPIHTALPVAGAYPAGTYPGSQGKLGIDIGWTMKNPFDQTLHLIPKVLHLGIGCRKGTAAEAIDQAVRRVLEEHSIAPRALKCAASIDLKAAETGLLDWCRERDLPISFYSAQELLALEGEFSRSAFVQSVAGVDCVCERAARMGAEDLIVKKYAENGVTVAIAAERYEVHFGQTDGCGHRPR